MDTYSRGHGRIQKMERKYPQSRKQITEKYVQINLKVSRQARKMGRMGRSINVWRRRTSTQKENYTIRTKWTTNRANNGANKRNKKL